MYEFIIITYGCSQKWFQGVHLFFPEYWKSHNDAVIDKMSTFNWNIKKFNSFATDGIHYEAKLENVNWNNHYNSRYVQKLEEHWSVWCKNTGGFVQVVFLLPRFFVARFDVETAKLILVRMMGRRIWKKKQFCNSQFKR